MTRNASLLRGDPASTRAPDLAIDAGLLCVMVVASLLSGSLTLLGETIRSGLLLVRDFSGVLIKRKALAGSLDHYEFDLGKLGQAWNLAVGLAMLLAGIWFAHSAIELMVSGESHTTHLALTLAAGALALVTLRSGLSMLAVLRAPQNRSSPADRTQLRARASRFASLVVLQLSMTLAALITDPFIALLADYFGATFVALFMTAAGARLIATAVLDMIDYPLNRRDMAYISKRLLDAGVEKQELLDLRSRRSGRRIFVEVTIEPVHASSFEEARQRMIRLSREMTDGRDDLDFAIKLRTSEA
jgi:divalent metal cation (Fe/Co/Zn/Cd) transporter